VLVLAGIDDPKLDSTASHPSSSTHSLPCRVVCHPGHPALTIMGGLVLWLQCSCFVLSLSVGRQSVSVSVTAITELQIRRHFRLRPKPEKLFSVGLYYLRKELLRSVMFVLFDGWFVRLLASGHRLH